MVAEASSPFGPHKRTWATLAPIGATNSVGQKALEDATLSMDDANSGWGRAGSSGDQAGGPAGVNSEWVQRKLRGEGGGTKGSFLRVASRRDSSIWGSRVWEHGYTRQDL